MIVSIFSSIKTTICRMELQEFTTAFAAQVRTNRLILVKVVVLYR